MRLKTVFFAMATACLSMNATAFNIEEATIESIHNAISANKLTCTELVNLYINRIKELNLSTEHSAPINAFTEINPSVFYIAQQLDQGFAETGKLSGPLHCIPVVLKDNIDTNDMTTTTGSYALLGNQPVKDAFLVKQLRHAGAIIFAKTGMDEFAWGISGISSRSGRVGNAYNPFKNPGGSSSGSAAAVSANFAMLSIGTDNSGSVRIPAAFNGIVGLRPSTGLISQSGIFPMGKVDGTAGPLARTTKDLAILLDVIARPDSSDAKTKNAPRVKSYTAFLNENGLKDKRIGIVLAAGDYQTMQNMSEDLKQALTKFKQKMKSLGVTLVELKLPNFNNNRDDNGAGEIQDVNRYLQSFPATRANFKDICNSDRTRTFGDKSHCLKLTADIAKNSKQKYNNAMAIFAKNRKYVHQAMDDKKLDALLMPITTNGSATYDSLAINTWRAPISSNAGLPAITINIGYDKDGMPIGVELIGKQFNEGKLIEMAYAYEKNTAPRTPPIMPNPSFIRMTIPQLNNVFTLIGVRAYNVILKNAKEDVKNSTLLSGGVFRDLVLDIDLRKLQDNMPTQELDPPFSN